MHQSISELEHWYPNIVKTITAIWGTIELNVYLTDLIVMDTYNRQGFPDVVLSEILTLYLINTDLTTPPIDDVWLNRK